MPYVKGHYRKGRWVRPHYRRSRHVSVGAIVTTVFALLIIAMNVGYPF